ncbi:succinyl-CoA ligase subunit beta [Pasteurella multocida]|nr:succinyl-CoA ligase subunit beta [Pasteurella multocida]
MRNEAEVRAFADQWLGQRLVTFQTDANGQPVNTLYVEEGSSIARELYLGAVLDRASQRVVFMVSTEGGGKYRRSGGKKHRTYYIKWRLIL